MAKPREWTFSDGGNQWYVEGPKPDEKNPIGEKPFKVIEVLPGSFHQMYRETSDKLEKAIKLAKLQEKLLVCYRVGKQPGKWLDEIGPLKQELFHGMGNGL